MAEMTPRERWLAILNRQDIDRVPTDYWGTTEVSERLRRDLNCATQEELLRALHIDAPRGFGPRYTKETLGDRGGMDMWGIRYEMVNYGTGEYLEAVEYPLAHIDSVEQVHAHRWPQVDDFDFGEMRRQTAEDDGYRIRRAGVFEPFLLYCRLRGMEQAYEDLLVNPELAEAILGHLYDFFYTLNRRMFEAGGGKIDLTYVAEDLAGQTGPLFSLETYRSFFLPRQKQMADLARSFGIHVFYHTDGAARCFVPDLIDVVGIEVLNPLQWRCAGMELAGLARDFGDRIAFHGGIDNQQTLPFGRTDDVIREVKEAAAGFKDCRWICAPCHNIQAVTPTENVVAMYQAIRAVGSK